jgi:uncharacterized protein (DUF1684 family)
MKTLSKIVSVLIILISNQFYSQIDEQKINSDIEAIAIEINDYQNSLNEEFRNEETTILDPEDFEDFETLEFYPVDLKFHVEASFIRTPNEKPFLMKTSTDRLPEYVKYGEAHFDIDGVPLLLNLYKSTKPVENPEDDYVFLPFTDLTSGDGSYGGGRYLDLDVPQGDTIIIDFNKSYNPYCAYSKRFSCPIPPKENDLLIRIEAGVKDFGDH